MAQEPARRKQLVIDLSRLHTLLGLEDHERVVALESDNHMGRLYVLIESPQYLQLADSGDEPFYHEKQRASNAWT